MRNLVMRTPSLALLLLAPLVAHAAGGAYEINQDCAAVGCFAGDTPGFPVTISVSGRYVLTSDLVATPGADVLIDGGAGHVDLDLAGHTVDGGQTCTGTPVTTCTAGPGGRGIQMVTSPVPMEIRLHDGAIHGFSFWAIFLSNVAEGSVLERLTASESGTGILLSGTVSATTMRVRDSQISRNFGVGMTPTNTGGRLFVENCSVVGNANSGLNLYGGAVAVGNRFTSNANQGINCIAIGGICALGQNTFHGNNGGGASAQWAITTVRDMGGNVCLDDGTCP